MKKKIKNINGDTLKLIIDATNIPNKCGQEDIGYGSENKKKKFTKLTIVSHKFGQTQ
jgi:hypothetical protein